MDAQVRQAISIAWDPTSSPDLKGQAFAFLDQLQTEPGGWQVCIELFSRSPKEVDIVRHVALEILNNAIKNQLLDAENLVLVRNALLDYTRRVYGGGGGGTEVDKSSVQGKLAQTFTYLFSSMYLVGWESFFDDFIAIARSGQSSIVDRNAPGMKFYLKILSSVHDEIADVMVPRSEEGRKQSTELKDVIRQRDASKIVSTWQEFLSQWRLGYTEIVTQLLTIIGQWVSWIDISLILQEGLMIPIFEIVGRPMTSEIPQDNLRDTGIDTLTEIVAKKMKPADKMELIRFLNLGNVIAQLVASPPLQKTGAEDSHYDIDMAETLGNLVNEVVRDIVIALDNLSIAPETRAEAEELLQQFMPWVLRFFSDEYDDVCLTVIPALTDLLAYFRRDIRINKTLSPQYASMLSPILHAIILKMRYDDESSWGDEGELTDEGDFLELRKKLQVLQQAVAAVNETLFIEAIKEFVGSTFDRFSQQAGRMDWRDLDLVLFEMFPFGELAVKNGGLYSKGQPTSPAAEALTAMMSKLVQSNLASYPHPAIQLQYMEICVRYSSFFEMHQQFIPRVLEDFVRLVHHNHVRVRTRSWYLFQRLVKQLRARLGNVSETVIQAIADLLEIRVEMPKAKDNDEDLLSSGDSDQTSSDTMFNSQLYLFEAIGCISSTSSVPVEKQVLVARTISGPLFATLEKYLLPAKEGNERAVLYIHHAIMALGTLAKGYSDGTPGVQTTAALPAKPVGDEFERAAEAVLMALESLSTFISIRTAARSAFSRLLVVLGARILPQLPRWIDGLLSVRSSKDEMTTFLRVLEQVIHGFRVEMLSILDPLLTPLLRRIFEQLSEPTGGTDDVIQLSELRREYLNLILVVFHNDVDSVLISSTNQGNLESLITSVEVFARDATDLPTAKIAFTVLNQMATRWGGNGNGSSSSTSPQTSTTTTIINGNGPITTPTPTTTSNTTNNNNNNNNTPIPGFNNFMITRFSTVCWTALSSPGFNPRDATSRQVAGEIASLQKTIYVKTGLEFITHLRDVSFPEMGLEMSMAEEYLNALQIRDLKAFRAFFLQFVTKNAAR
ncbi:MAG: hypothetical protein M1823_001438 [Watsoniomyces obsoletus]|nr:MAG: hypothetical protein M1823_001438 [Watsoniomyces obsoletus]